MIILIWKLVSLAKNQLADGRRCAAGVRGGEIKRTRLKIMNNTRHLIFCVLAMFLLANHLPGQNGAVFAGVERIVAIGDVHGDSEQFVQALKAAGVIDGKGNWQAGKTHLVQVGDVLDRGPTSKQAIDLLMKLAKQAQTAGGKVHCLVGNHEALVMYGKYNYVHPGEFAAFGGKEAFAKAFSPAGKYGQWIAGNKAMVKINDYLFVHAGIHHRLNGKSIEQINGLIRAEMANPVEPSKSLSLKGDGPLWYRGLALENGAEIEKHFTATLQAFEAKAMVSGHTVSKKGIRKRFDGRYFMIDTGMSKAYGGKPQALVIESGQVSVADATDTKGKKILIPKPETVEHGQ